MYRLGKLAWPVAALAACCTAAGCASVGRSGTGASRPAARPLVVELLALDLSTCGRCTGTDRNIEAAVRDLRPVLAQAGVDLQFRKTVVQSADRAASLHLRSSPSLRINGRDTPIELRESRCGDCASLKGLTRCPVDCRVWVWKGREYTEAPKGLVVDAVLRAYPSTFDPPPTPRGTSFELPDNLKRFFAARADGDDGAARPCCADSGSKTRAVSR